MDDVSVAMATFNGGRFLPEQLDSIAAQTLAPAELVIYDDGSCDDTHAIVNAFARTAAFPVRLVINGERLGPSDNFFKAVSVCTSPLVALCDQDDVWLPEKLAVSVGRLTADRSLLSLHTATLTDEHLRPVGLLRQGIASDAVIEPLQPLPYDNAGWGMSMTFRREIALLSPPAMRPPSPVTGKPTGHDTWLYVLATALGRVSLIDRPLILYRQHQSNAYGVRAVPLSRRLRGLITVPLDRHRACLRFFSEARDRFGEIAAAGGRFAAPAALARDAFDRRARQTEDRLRLYLAPSFSQRLRSLRTCHHGRRSGYASLIKDIALGLLRMGRLEGA